LLCEPGRRDFPAAGRLLVGSQGREGLNSRGPESLAGLAKETGPKPGTVAEVPRGRDLVVTISHGKIPNLPPGLFKDAPDDLIVIDTGNQQGCDVRGRAREQPNG
jgi:hypothetical protein